MYLVISQWEVIPGHEQQFMDSGQRMRSFLRSLPGVEFVESIKGEDGRIHVVHAYTDEATYNRIVNDPNGQFGKKLKEEGTESHARWISSTRGETTDAGSMATRTGQATVR